MTTDANGTQPSIEATSDGQPPPGGYRSPGLQDIAIEHSPQRNDVMRDMITGSGQIEDYLPRAVMTAQELKAVQRFMSDDAFMETGNPEIATALWMGIMGSPAVGGRAREDAVSMYTGRPTGGLDRLTQGIRGMLGGGGRGRRRGGNQGSNAQDFKGG